MIVFVSPIYTRVEDGKRVPEFSYIQVVGKRVSGPYIMQGGRQKRGERLTVTRRKMNEAKNTHLVSDLQLYQAIYAALTQVTDPVTP